MTETVTDENKNCFIITPIGNDTGPERRFADGITNAVLRPVLEEYNLVPVVAHEISATGSINDQVIQHIYEDKLAICNLTGLNPNVMYELGVRYTMRKHTILICENGTRLPFDIISERTIFYKNDIAGSIELRNNLKEMIEGIDFDDLPINPIFRVLDFDAAMGNIKEQDAGSAIIEKMQEVLQSYSVLQATETAKSFGIAVIERTDGINFIEEDFSKFTATLLNDSNRNVYPSRALWLKSQQGIVLKYGMEIDSKQAFIAVGNAVFKVFGKNVDVNSL